MKRLSDRERRRKRLQRLAEARSLRLAGYTVTSIGWRLIRTGRILKDRGQRQIDRLGRELMKTLNSSRKT